MKRFLGFKLVGSSARHEDDSADNDFYIAGNTDIYDVTATLPTPAKGKKWYCLADTSVAGDMTVAAPGKEELLKEQQLYVVPAGSFVILISK